MFETSYSTTQLAKLFDISPRQLQWIDERDIVQPRCVGHRREWTAAEAIEVGIISELRRKGLSLQMTRRVIRSARRLRLKDSAPIGYLTTDGKMVAICFNPNDLLDRLKTARRGIVVVSIEDVAARVQMNVRVLDMAEGDQVA